MASKGCIQRLHPMVASRRRLLLRPPASWQGAGLRTAGARTFGQDEASCVVFGMPCAAHERGGTERLLPLGQIRPHVANLAGRAGPRNP